MRVGTWNVRTLLGTGAARLLTKELEAANISIMALQEVRWTGSGEQSVGSYKILWSGPPEGCPRQAGVAIALDKSAAAALCEWHPISDRILMAKFRHRYGTMSVLAVYAPTNDAQDTVKDEFYDSLEAITNSTKRNDLTICLGDFNAVTGCSRDSPHIIGPFGSGVANDN
jgi:exonuclease III